MKVTVINPAEWSVRTVILVFDCVMIASLCEGAGLRHNPGKKTDPELSAAEVKASCDGICQGLATHTRGRSEELIGGSRQDNQLDEVRGLGRGRQTHLGWGGEKEHEIQWKKSSRTPQTNPKKGRENAGPERIFALTRTLTPHSRFSYVKPQVNSL